MDKKEEIRKSGQRTLISLTIIGVAVYLGFTPLFELIKGGVAGAFVGSAFGAIFVIVMTMYLLNKQTEIEQESKKSENCYFLQPCSRGTFGRGFLKAETP